MIPSADAKLLYYVYWLIARSCRLCIYLLVESHAGFYNAGEWRLDGLAQVFMLPWEAATAIASCVTTPTMP